MGSSSKQKTGVYKYFLGLHAVFILGHADKVKKVLFAEDKLAWEGSESDGTLTINKPDLFGGEDSEGGVAGAIDFETGLPAQTQNSYLLNLLGEFMPAFRGVSAFVFRGVSSGGFFFGNNPYLKVFAARLQRIFLSGTEGEAQWYPEKAAIGYSSLAPTVEGLTATVSWYQSSYIDHDQATMGIGFLDNTDTLIGTPTYEPLWSPAVSSDAEFWVGRSHSATVPSNAVAIRIFIKMDRQGGFNNNGYVDDISLTVGGVNVVLINPGAEGGETAGYATGWHNVGYQPDFDVDGSLRVQNAAPTGTHSGDYRFWGDQCDHVHAYQDVVPTLDFFDFLDMNPAHILRECLNCPDYGMGYSDEDIDDTSFEAAADTLYAERMGMSLPWDRQMIIEDFIKEVVKHINAALYVDRETGKFTLDLIRDDYDIDDLITLDTSNIDRVADFTQPAFGELITSVTAKYWDSSTGKDAGKTLSDDALAAMQQANINTTMQYQGFTNSNIIDRILQRDLKVLSTPLISCTIYAKRVAGSLKIGKCFKWTWPDYEVENLVMRVTGIAYGDGKIHRVRITCTQDIYTMPTQAFTPPTPPDWEDPTGTPPTALTNRLPIEAPYYELIQQQGSTAVDTEIAGNADLGYVGIAAAQNASEMNAKALTDAGAGFEEIGTLDFCPIALLDEVLDATAADKQQTTFDIADGINLDEVQLGTVVQLNDELMEVVVLTSSSITVERAVLDTVPGVHAIGDVLYFWDLFLTIDPTQYIESDSVDVKILPSNGSETLAEADAPTDTVVVAGRASKPYPPGRFKINGSYYPTAVAPVAAFAVTWVDRNRLTQADQLVGTFEAAVTPAEGTTRYALRFKRADTLALLVEKLNIGALTANVILFYTGDVICELYAISDNGESWQRHSHVFTYTMPVGTLASSITATAYDPAANVTIIHGGIVAP